MSPHESRAEITAYIKERADIVEIIGEHVDLKRSGVRYLGLCPFHHEKTPSFSVHAGQQFYYCFGCGEAGDVFSFMMKYHHLDFPAAVAALAGRYQIALPEPKRSPREREQQRRRQVLFELNRKAAGLYRDCLLDPVAGKAARDYLDQRGIPEALQERYQLGYAPAPEAGGWNFLGGRLEPAERSLAIEAGLLVKKEQGGTYDRFRGRLLFPVVDGRGEIAGFGGRTLGEDNPKYLNSPESPVYNKSRLLFGLHPQREAIRRERRATLVEGNFDLLSLVAHGFEAVVAPLGTALTRDQLRLLKPLTDEVVLLFDGDSAGLKAAERAVPLFLAEQVSGRVVLLPEAHDPDSFVREYGLEALRKLTTEAEPLPEFVVGRLVDRHGLSLDGKGRLIEDLKPLLKAAASSLQQSVMAAHFADILGIDPEILLRQLTADGQGPAAVGPETGRLAERPAQAAVRQPLGEPLRGLVEFMVLQPWCFAALKEAGLGELLDGTVGEILFLQLDILVERLGDRVQPEDLLSHLPEGEERQLVATLLQGASRHQEPPAEESGRARGELEEILDWLRQANLKKRSEALLKDISEAQKTKDFSLLAELLKRKAELDRQLKSR